jgi:uncharacterized protein HemY
VETAGKQLDVLKSVYQISGMIFCGEAKWQQAEESLEKAISYGKTVGDLKSVEQSLIYLGHLRYLKGEIDKSVEVNLEALESGY